MAGRFVVQKLAAGMFRSRAVLVAHGPSARAAAPSAGTAPVAGTPPVAGAVRAARYFSRTSMPSVINPVKPACVDSFGGAKEPLSSMAFTEKQMSSKERIAAFESRIDAINAARLAQHEASRAELKARFAEFDKFVMKVTMLSCFAGSCVLWATFEAEKRRISLSKGQSGSI